MNIEGVVNTIARANDPWRVMRALLEAADTFVTDCINDEEVDATEGFTPNELGAMHRRLEETIDMIASVQDRTRKET